MSVGLDKVLENHQRVIKEGYTSPHGQGYVSASDVVSVRFQNESGGVLDLAEGTIRVRVFKQ